jgi:ABC-type transport system substrate-binding protein
MKLKYFKNIFIVTIILLILAGIYIIYIKRGPAKNNLETQGKETNVIKEFSIGVTDFDTINPILSKNLEIQYLNKLIYEPLVNITRDFNVEPSIAEEWSKIDDVTYIIKLDEGKTWENGRRVQVEDVENTIEVIKKENTIYKENVQKIGQIEKIDETTMKIYLTEPVNFFEYFLCFPIIDINTYNTEIPMGTGKYKYTNITENQITIESSDNKIIVKLFKNSTELYNNFTRENVDIIITKNPNYENYIGNIGFEETIIPGRTFYYILLENISDVNMRKWLDMATNKEKLIYNLYNKKYIPANTPLAYGSYLNLSNEKQQEKDQELFTQKKMNLTISVKNEDKIIAEKMQEQLKEYEINLRIQTYQNSKADLILKKQTTTITPDISQYFSEEKMKKQIKQANEIENKQILKQKYQQILNEYKEQMPFISLFFDSYIILHNKKLKGDFSGNWYNIFYNVDGWYKSI